MKQVRIVEAREATLAALRDAGSPGLVRNLVATWPIVSAAKGGSDGFLARLAANSADGPLKYSEGDPSIDRSFHYSHDGTPRNFTRHFALFSPKAVGDLYMGPIKLTPGGLPIIMVHVSPPDFERFSRFAAALEQAQVAEPAPGDALYIPYQWYHNVVTPEPINILINYWWNAARQDLGSPWDTLLHGVIALRELPPVQPRARKAMFDYDVFLSNGTPGEHLSTEMRGVLEFADPARAAQQKRQLISNLGDQGAGKTGPFG